MTTRWRGMRGPFLVVVVIGALLAGCGQSSGQSSSSGSAGGGNGSSSEASDGGSGGGSGKDPASHPCDFVTQAEAEAIIKQPIDAPHVGVAGGCNYSGSGSNLKETILGFSSSRDKSDYDNGKKALKDPKDVSGLGDAATCETHVGTAGTIAQLLVYSKKAKQTITVTGDSCEEDRVFAEKALGRL